MLPCIITEVPKIPGTVSIPTRLGTPIDKGAKLTTEKMIVLEEKLKEKINFYCTYPDLWVDEVLIPNDSYFNLKNYQRLFSRSIARYSSVHITGARGLSKTFIGYLGLIHQAIFKPGFRGAFAAPKLNQAISVSQQTVADILNRFPFLKNELISGKPLGGANDFELRFKNGSHIVPVSALDRVRGVRFDAMIFDEARDHDADMVNSILVPTLSRMRETAGKGITNPYEKRQIQIYLTSASSKSCYNYQKVLDTFVKMVVLPTSSMVIGLDWRIPVGEGIYPASFVNDIKADPTMTEQVFAREYMSEYTAENEDSWFNFNTLRVHRRVNKAEWSANPKEDDFYTISVDVGRFHDATQVHIFKNRPKDGKIRTKLINTMPLGKNSADAQFSKQAVDLKKLIAAFNPREVAIDTNGLGAGLADLMIQEQTHEGITYPAYAFFNDDNYKKIQPLSAPRILFSFKANAKINSEMFSNCYSRIEAGLVDFLITEESKRTKLSAYQNWNKKSTAQKVQYLMPFEMTSRLFEEMGNQRLKPGRQGASVTLEPINSRFPDDRFSSLCIGLYRIKAIEDEYRFKKRRNSNVARNLVFFSGGHK